jgi:asparagine synthase (glutamine-hydrolysing)
MCGIAGFWAPGFDRAAAEAILARMTDTLEHRGPDDSGVWLDEERGVALGHRRLSILDLSPAGHQPMASRDGRYVMVFNGEIYNFSALRTQLAAAGDTFRGHSDTEVMLAAISRWGLEAAVGSFAGQFAFAIWDRESGALHLVRDRMGEKPLYYAWMGTTLLFGSELKALRAHPAWRGEIDRGALTLYLRHACVPAPYTIYTGVHKVEPATIVSVTAPGRFSVARYWKLEAVALAGVADPLSGSDEEVVDQAEGLLRKVVAEQMVADVPLGAFLSGGVDSSAVVALMQAESSRPVRTFTIGFDDAAFDEAGHARAVARHLGTDHVELYVPGSDALAVIPRIPSMFDEPFGDASAVPTFLVAQLARQQVTVALSGDGGDELFGGYNRHFHGERIWRRIAPVPMALRRAAALGIRLVTPGMWDRLLGPASALTPKKSQIPHLGERMHRLAGVVPASSEADFYLRLASHFPDPASVVVGGHEPLTALTSPNPVATLSHVEQMMYFDARTYLHDDVLTKVDRATLAVSLESRAPLLDHRMVELGWKIPLHLKVRGGVGKIALRRILDRHVPRELIERPKMGFGVPLAAWLRGPLRKWAGDLLSADRIRTAGFLVPGEVTKRWDEHLAGRRNWQDFLWDVLMFEAWRETI